MALLRLARRGNVRSGDCAIQPTHSPASHQGEDMMIKRVSLLTCLALALPLAAVAQSQAQTTQQQKMAACNKEAGEKSLKGDERKAFMSQCLSGEKMTQQDKMTACNKQAGDKALKGDERKKFMSECLKG
jgi:hypothetical protein